MKKPPRLRAALAGVLAALVAVAVAELVAGLVLGARSLIIGVGDQVIDLTPGPVKDFAIATFGTADKLALLVGIGILLIVFAAVIGLVGLRRPLAGTLGVVTFGLVGAAASLTQTYTGGLVASLLPSVVGTAAGVVALRLLLAPLRAASASSATREPGVDRRAFLRTAGIVAVAVTVAGGAGRWLQQQGSAIASRADIVLPRAGRTLPPVAAVATEGSVDAAGAVPFFTPNADFYRIDTALQVPQVSLGDYRLRVTGMVDEALELTFDQLTEEDLVEADITLTCVSNEVGGRLAGTARWLGVPLRTLLERAGVQEGADQVVGRSVDDYTCGFPLSVALDGRDALVAVGMNGEPLPLEHGFPVRLIVPGLYGYVSATKWLSEIELTTFAATDHYWVSRGWAVEAPIKTASRIDVPASFAQVPAGRVAVAGVAWAQTRGIQRVEVQVDDQPWAEARLAGEVNTVTWRQWVYDWDATPGLHRIRVRATDSTGATQPEERVAPIPDGATGWHTTSVTVLGA